MGVGRRQVLLGGFGIGIAAAAAGPRSQPRATRVGDSAGLQHLWHRAGGRRDRPDRDAATRRRRRRRRPARLSSCPPGSIRPAASRSNPAPRSRACRDASILRYRDGGAMLGLDGVENVAAGRPRARRRSQAARRRRRAARGQPRSSISISPDCRFIGSSENGVVLRQVSGWIRNCEIGDIRKGGLFSEDAGGLEIAQQSCA